MWPMSQSPAKKTMAPANNPQGRHATAVGQFHGLMSQFKSHCGYQHAGTESHDQAQHLVADPEPERQQSTYEQ